MSDNSPETPTPQPESKLFYQVPRRGRVPKLYYLMQENPATFERILMMIERGAWDYVVCEAFGISYASFLRWMERGSRAKEGTLWREFYDRVSMAKARARIIAEMEVYAHDKKFYLTHGPGKSRQGRPGWGQETVQTLQGNSDQPLSLSVSTKEQAKPEDLLETLKVMLELGFIHATVMEPIHEQSALPSPPGKSAIPESAPGNGSSD